MQNKPSIEVEQNDQDEDDMLLKLAEERIAKGGSTTSLEDVMRECGITEEELANADDVELE